MTELDPKPWYASRTVWGGVVAALAGVLVAVGVEVDQPALTEALAGIGAAVGGLIAIVGRLAATRPIRRSGNSGD